MVLMWDSEDNLQNWFLSPTMWILGIELIHIGLVGSALTH